MCPQHLQAQGAVTSASSSPAALQVRVATHSAHHFLTGLSSFAPSNVWPRRTSFPLSHTEGRIVRVLFRLAVSVPSHMWAARLWPQSSPLGGSWLPWLVHPTARFLLAPAEHRCKHLCTWTWGSGSARPRTVRVI